MFVHTLVTFIALVEFTSKFSVKVSLSGYISLQPLIRKHSYLDHGSLRGSASMPLGYLFFVISAVPDGYVCAGV